jgi:hypothetical protein
MHTDDQGFWNFWFTIIFGVQLAGATYILLATGKMPTSIPLFDFALVVLATYRLTRLFVYDKITQFVRDWFLIKATVVTGAGDMIVTRQKPSHGPRRTLADLLDCPWCFGVWAALFVTFVYFITPIAWYPIFILAVAGLATLVHLTSNMIGWKAELLKKTVERDHV